MDLQISTGGDGEGMGGVGGLLVVGDGDCPTINSVGGGSGDSSSVGEGGSSWSVRVMMGGGGRWE